MELADILCCPACQGDLAPRPEARRAGSPPAGATGYACPACGVEYPAAGTLYRPRGRGASARPVSLDTPSRAAIYSRHRERGSA
jgi:uncharacterized protein YbaR (Trm112 family)